MLLLSTNSQRLTVCSEGHAQVKNALNSEWRSVLNVTGTCRHKGSHMVVRYSLPEANFNNPTINPHQHQQVS
jgi:hypothetical protein